ncbi:MAG: UDP-glucose 4-epimerase [Blastocatellia bacterium]|nr:UDP-glucose 4-epimerase [Blastocatellia bacterium]
MGGSVGRYAARAGHQVMGTGRSGDAGAGWPGEYVQAVPTADNFGEIIRNFAPDLLLHAAGSASVGDSLSNPLGDLNAAAVTCANLFEGVRLSGARPRVVVPSSASVYGNPETLPINEDARVEPISPYGFHKAICELLAREYSSCFGLDITVCRFFSVFGPAQRRLLIWELYRQLAGPDPIVWLDGKGSESRDFLYIDDVARVVLQLAQQREQTAAGGNYTVLNIGRGIETGVQDIARQLREIIAPDKEIRCRGNARPGDPLRWQADISRLRSILPGWQPGSLADGLALCIADWKSDAWESANAEGVE